MRFTVGRKLLKDTGRKLAHVEMQLRTGLSISTELTERLKEHSLSPRTSAIRKVLQRGSNEDDNELRRR